MDNMYAMGSWDDHHDRDQIMIISNSNLTRVREQQQQQNKTQQLEVTCDGNGRPGASNFLLTSTFLENRKKKGKRK